MRDMRKFLFNGAIWSAMFGIIGVVKQTSTERSRLRTVLLWLSWGLTLALAISAIIDESREERELAGLED